MNSSVDNLRKVASGAKVEAMSYDLVVSQDYFEADLNGYAIRVRMCPGVVDYVWAWKDKSDGDREEAFELPRNTYLELRKLLAVHLLKFDCID